MKESKFIEDNESKWQEFERELDSNSMNPVNVTRFYVDIIDDLSFARTHYPNRLVRSYLNGISQILSLKIHRSGLSNRSNFIKFWKVDLPLTIYEHRSILLLTTIIFFAAALIGAFSTYYNPDFPIQILGQNYVDTTIENIEKGDPMAIYKDPDELNMFLGITINNLFVSAYTYISSLVLGIGTIIAMLNNGVMLGCFLFFFVERGLTVESFLTIWQHGVIEIFSILLAGTAGLILAKGIIFPGSYSRLDAFRIAGRKSIVIMLGLMPLLVFSGAIEGFLTRHTDLPDIVRLLSILMSLSFIGLYFIWYPRYVAKSALSTKQTDFQTRIEPISIPVFHKDAISAKFSIVWEAIKLVSTYKKKVAIFTSMVVSLSIILVFSEEYLDEVIFLSDKTYYRKLHSSIDYLILTSWDYMLVIIGFIAVSSASYLSSSIIAKDLKLMDSFKLVPQLVFSIITAVVFMLLSENDFTALLVFFAMPICLYYSMYSMVEQPGISNPFNLVFSKHIFIRVIGYAALSYFALTFSSNIVQLLISNFLSSVLVSLLGMDSTGSIYAIIIDILVFSLSYLFLLITMLFAQLEFFTLQEIKHATNLNNRIVTAFGTNQTDTDKTGILSLNNINSKS